MSEVIMTEAARTARANYYKSWKDRNPDKVKRYQLTVWENKAKKCYGDSYVPPEDDNKLSDQAAELRRAYNKSIRHKNRDKVKANNVRYWNRKANNK